jgi:hypothetical protein
MRLKLIFILFYYYCGPFLKIGLLERSKVGRKERGREEGEKEEEREKGREGEGEGRKGKNCITSIH